MLLPSGDQAGNSIAYSNGAGINLVRPDGRGRRPLGVAGECSVWSPDGSELMFCSNGVNRGEGVDNWDVFVMDADGTNVRRLTSNVAQDYPGAWSPDGTQIAFFSRRDGDGDVYVMDADGANLRRVTNQPGAQAADAWLADGRLVIGSAREGWRGRRSGSCCARTAPVARHCHSSRPRWNRSPGCGEPGATKRLPLVED